MVEAPQMELPFIEYLTRDALIGLVADSIKAAYVYEMQAFDPDGPPYELQTKVYITAIRFATKRLREFEFVKNHRGSQARLICRSDRFPMPIRLLFCKGERLDSRTVKVNDKSGYSFTLVRQNSNKMPQMDFTDIDSEFRNAMEWIETGTDHEEDALNYWFYWHIDRDILTITASFPDAITGRTIMHHSQSANLSMLYLGRPLTEGATAVCTPV